MGNYELSVKSCSTGYYQEFSSDNVEEIRQRIEKIEEKYAKVIEVWSDKHDDYIYENRCCNVKINKLFNFKNDLRKKDCE